jgi:excisionase family DNA binding protein
MDQTAYTLRGVERALGIDRRTVSAAIRAGELPAARLGSRRLLILATDIETWLRRHAIQPTARAELLVERVLAREARRAG